MSPYYFSVIFLLALALSTGLRLWLDLRHLRHVAAHRERVPDNFAGRIDLADHRKAADYTVAKLERSRQAQSSGRCRRMADQ